MVQFGIWIFDKELGIIGKPEKFPDLFLKNDRIWDVEETASGPVWKWPVSFAKVGWFNPEVANDFNKTFFYAQNFFEGFKPQDFPEKLSIDARTVQLQTDLLMDTFPGPDEELDLRT